MTENVNLYSTTVKGDPGKIKAIKQMGHGSLSRAFRIGCDVLLGITSDDVEKLTEKRNILEQERSVSEVKIEQLNMKIEKLTSETAQTKLISQNEEGQFNRIVSEFIRCAPLIIFKKQTQLIDHLASLGMVNASEIREFFNKFEIEPTESEIMEFLKR